MVIIMNKKQIELLIENGYEVFEDFGFIHELNINNPKVCIVYNSLLKQFCLNTCGTTLEPDEIKSYQDEVNYKSNLAKKLNELK